MLECKSLFTVAIESISFKMSLTSPSYSYNSFTKDPKKLFMPMIIFLIWIFAKLIFIKCFWQQIRTFCRDMKKADGICSFFYSKIKRIRTWKIVLLLIIISICLLLLKSYRHQLNDAFIALHGEKPCFTSTQDLDNIRYMVHSFHTVMTNHSLVYWIDCGTLLGAFRYKDVIPWDHDGDISYLLSDLPKVKQFVVPDLVKRFAININEDNPVSMKYNGTDIDLFQYTTYAKLSNVEKPPGQSNSTLTRAKYRLSQVLEIYFDTERHLALPTGKCLFAGRYVNCPAKPKELLRHRYPHTLDRRMPYKLQCWLPWNLWKIWVR